MGACFSNPDGLANDSPVSSSEDDKSLCMKINHNAADLGLSVQFHLKLEEKTQLDSMAEDLFASSPCGVCGRDGFGSSHMSSEQANENPYKLVSALDRAQPSLQLVPTKLSRLSLSPSSKSSRMINSSNSACREDRESPRRNGKGLLVSHLLNRFRRNVRRSSTSEISISIPDNVQNMFNAIQRKRTGCLHETHNMQRPQCPCSEQGNEIHANSQETTSWNTDIYSITGAAKKTKQAPLLSNNLKEAGKLNPDKVDLPAATFNELGSSFERKDSHFQTLELNRSYSLSLKMGDNAFGSPVSVDGRKEERRGRPSIDEWSDSSSDLFDIDFRKSERLAAGIMFLDVNE